MEKNKLIQYLENVTPETAENIEYDEEAIVKEVESDHESKTSSTLIKVLSVIGGLLTSLAFIGFLAISQLLDSSGFALMVGLAAVLFSYFINRNIKKVFIETLGISAYIIGVLLLTLGFSVSYTDFDPQSIALINLLIGALSYLLARTFTFNLITLLHVLGAAFAYIVSARVYYGLEALIIFVALLYTFVLSKEALIVKSYVKFSLSYTALKTSFLIALLFCLYFYQPVSQSFYFPYHGSSFIIGPVLLLLTNFILWKILLRLSIKQLSHRAGIFVICNLILLLVIGSPELIGSILILLGSFYVNDKTGIGAGIIAFLYSVSLFYYDLEFTLLTKSIMLMVSGVLFLVFYFILRKTMSNE